MKQSPGSIERLYTVYATAFPGPDSMINIPVPNIMDNGEFMGSGGSRHSLVTIADRYDWYGEYLDCFQTECLNELPFGVFGFCWGSMGNR